MKNFNKVVYSRLSPDEKIMIRELSGGFSVFFQAIAYEEDIIQGFIEDLQKEKKRPRKPYRFYTKDNIKDSILMLRSYLNDNFSFNPTDQEIYWLTCRYLFSKFPGFRGTPPN